MENFIMPARPENSNKGTFGKVLNISGCDNYIGAAYLSSLAALKVGAGLVALSSTKKVTDSVSKLLPEAVYLERKQGLKDIENYTVYLIGCGLGQTKQSKKDFIQFMKKISKQDKPTVIDADGLNILSEIKEKNDLQLSLPQNTIITPHPMEGARLLGVKLNDVLNNLEDSARELSKKYKVITVLKTHRTIITDGQQLSVNQFGNSALAKAGTGDVLAGIISGLLAQNTEHYESARLGVYLHSRAGEIASNDLTEYSVLATDVIRYLPNAIKGII